MASIGARILCAFLLVSSAFANLHAQAKGNRGCGDDLVGDLNNIVYRGMRGFVILKANQFFFGPLARRGAWKQKKNWKISALKQGKGNKWTAHPKHRLIHRTPVTVVDEMFGGTKIKRKLLVVRTAEGSKRIINARFFTPHPHWKCGFDTFGEQDVVLAQVVGRDRVVAGKTALGNGIKLMRGTMLRCDGQKNLLAKDKTLALGQREVHCVTYLRGTDVDVIYSSKDLKILF